MKLITTTPSVLYKIKERGIEKSIYSPQQLSSEAEEIREPWARLEIITPQKYLSQIIGLVKNKRGEYRDTKYLTAERAILTCEIPLAELITDFYDKLKNLSSGYASLNYELMDWRIGDLARLNILAAGERVDALSRIVPRARAYEEGKSMVEKLKEILPAQLFAVALQAEVDGRIIARETMKAMRKDVTGYLYGGDYTRKRKLLEKQKKGKKLLKEKGRVRIPPEVFLKILKK